MAGWMDYFSNPRGQYLKKTMYEVLKDRYHPHDAVVERLSSALVTEADLSAFLKMIGDIYESAYLKAVEDHKEQLAKLGLSVRIVPPGS